MPDLLFFLLSLGFFVLCVGLVQAFERLRGPK